jgi:hypothetical protein
MQVPENLQEISSPCGSARSSSSSVSRQRREIPPPTVPARRIRNELRRHRRKLFGHCRVAIRRSRYFDQGSRERTEHHRKVVRHSRNAIWISRYIGPHRCMFVASSGNVSL